MAKKRKDQPTAEDKRALLAKLEARRDELVMKLACASKLDDKTIAEIAAVHGAISAVGVSTTRQDRPPA